MKRHFLPLLFLISSICSSQTQNKTISDYDKLIKYNPTDMSNYYNRGLLKADEADFIGAISDFDVVVENDEKNINALYNRALAKAEINDTNGAVKDLSEILKFDSNNSDVYFKRSFLNATIGNRSQACLDAKKASSLGSLDAESLISMLCN
jgi:tetratricopeptide (TPR) repeat protein